MNNALKKGDRIRLKVRTFFGWKGCGTVLHDCDDDRAGLVYFHPDGDSPEARAVALRCEVARLRGEPDA